MNGLNIKAVAFDAYGTLVEIGDKRRPFSRLAALAGERVMASPLIEPIGLEEMYAALSRPHEGPSLESLKTDLACELASIRPYPEANAVLAQLRRKGFLTAVASNLAKPYATPLCDLFGRQLDVSCLSFSVNAVKPEPAFYEALCNLLQLAPSEILMVGDTWRCDYAGAAGAGLNALHLDRRGNADEKQEPVSIRDLYGVLAALGIEL